MAKPIDDNDPDPWTPVPVGQTPYTPLPGPRLPPKEQTPSGRRRSVTPGNPVPENPISVPTVPALPEWPEVPPPSISPRPVEPPVQPESRELTYNARGAASRVIYGHVENVGLQVAWWNADDYATAGARLVVHYIVGFGPIQGISDIKLGDKLLSEIPLPAFGYQSGYNQYWGYEIFLGTKNQAVSQALTQFKPGWVPTRYPGIAHIVLAFPPFAYYNTVGMEGVPDVTSATCTVDGKLILDPIQDATLTNRYFSENTSLAIADFLNAARYGGRIPKEKINWELLRTETAPFCNFQIAAGKPRYSLGLQIQLNQQLETIIENMRTHAQLFVSQNNGMYNILADMPRAWNGVHFTDENGLEGATMRIKGAGEVYTNVVTNFTDSTNEWQDTPAEAELSGVALGTREYISQSFSVPGIRTYEMAKRLATYLLNRSIQDKEITFRVNQLGARVLPGERARITDTELNLVNQDIIITDCQPDGDTWVYNAEIYSDAVYSDVIEETTVSPVPAQPSPYQPIPAPTGLTLGMVYEETTEGLFIPKLEINFDSHIETSGTRITLSVNGAAYQELGVFAKGPVRYTLNEKSGTTLVARAYSVHPTTGVASTVYAESALFTIPVVLAEPLADIQGYAGGQSNKEARLYWNKPPVRTRTTVPTANISQYGTLTAFTPANLQNGNIGDIAIDFTDNVVGGFVIDFGAAFALKEIELWFTNSNYPTINVHGSNDYATWDYLGGIEAISSLNAPDIPLLSSRRTAFQVAQFESDGVTVGNYRYYRVSKPSTSGDSSVASITDMKLVSYTGATALVKGYRIRGWKGDFLLESTYSGATDEFDIFFQPTAARMFTKSVEQRRESFDPLTGGGNGASRCFIEIASISPTNDISDFRRYRFELSWWAYDPVPSGLVQKHQPIYQGNIDISGGGTKNNVDISNYSGVVALTSATAATSISGFSRGISGRQVKIDNVSGQPVTLLANNAGSIVGNRFDFGHVIPVGGSLDIWYDGLTNTWKRASSYVVNWSDILSKPAVLSNLETSVTYGGLRLPVAAGGWYGVEFGNGDLRLMASYPYVGAHHITAGWLWRFSGGVMDIGTVPWSLVGSKPTTALGYGITDLAYNAHSGTYGGALVSGSKNGWGGLSFGHTTHLMANANSIGAYDTVNGWLFRFDGTAMVLGSVPWARLSSLPTGISRIGDVTSSYGSINISGGTNGYAGIHFSSYDRVLMVETAYQGFWSSTGWLWAFQNGSLVIGTVPWSQVNGRPTTLAGYGITDAAPLASPALTGVPTAPTAAVGTNNTQIATTAFVLANAGGDVYDVATADELFTSSTLTDSSISIPLVANGLYAVEAYIVIGPPSNSGVAASVKLNTGSTITTSSFITAYISGSAGTDMESRNLANNVDPQVGHPAMSLGSRLPITFKGTLEKNGSAGNLTVQLASTTPGVNYHIKKGSWLKVRKLN